MYDSFRVSKLFSKLNVSQKQTKTQSITFIKGRTVYNKLKLIRKLVIDVVLKGAVSRQSSSFCLILPITRPQSLWNLK